MAPTRTMPAHFRPAVVAPTFDNARTLPGVLNRLDALHLAILVVNDGATDATDSILQDWADAAAGHHAIRHARNRGKAAAMRTGFDAADNHGATHAVTIDTDGQHDPADLPALLAAAYEKPGAIILGVRPAADARVPWRSRLGRWGSDRLVGALGGVPTRDSQCGLRVYPLAITQKLGGGAGRYAYETQILVRAAFARVPIVEVPISCRYDVPGGRVSHFRPARDSLAVAALHLKLLGRSLAPWPVKRLGDAEIGGTIIARALRWLSPRRAWRDLRTSPAAREKLAPSAAAGAVVAALPLYGVKTYACLLLAKLLRLQPLTMLASSSLFSTPPLGPALAAGSIAAGHLLLRGDWPTLAAYDPRTRGAREVLKNVAAEWAVGGALLGAVLAAATYAAVRCSLALATRSSGSRTKSVPARHPATPMATSTPSDRTAGTLVSAIDPKPTTVVAAHASRAVADAAVDS